MHPFKIVLIAGMPAQPLAKGLVHDLYYGFVPALYRTGVTWLADGEAVELSIAVSEVLEAETIAEVIADQIPELPVDVALVADGHRRKKLLVADMDATIIAQECIDELADFAGLGEPIAGITERAMRGEIDFAAALTERVGLLAGLAESAIDAVLRERITLTPGARTLTATMRAFGARTLLVSGGFTCFAGEIAQRAGFDEHHANTLGIADGTLTGRVVPPILGEEAKLETLRAATRRLKIATAETLAVGDGANDLAMIRAAGLGVGFHAKPLVAARAPVTIRHGDLTALLYLQGYARTEFAE